VESQRAPANRPASHLQPVWFALTGLVAVWALQAGCRDGSAPSAKQQHAAQTKAATSELNTKLLESVTEMLIRLNQTDPAQGLRQIADRLNQWAGTQDPPDWQPDPMAAQVTERWFTAPGVDRMDRLQFDLADAYQLREALWLKRIADRAGRDTDLEIAIRLFDWTVRNVQLVDPNESAVEHLPTEILLLGRGTAEDRAWIFLLLARQAGLDAVMLATRKDGSSELRPWIPAIWIDQNWYLFDPQLGLPIPSPSEDAVATLAQARSDESVLKQLDLPADSGEESLYPVKADDLKNIVALVEASPSYLSRRMQLLESKLPGNHKLVLSFRPTHLAEEIQQADSPIELQIWETPLDRMQKRRRLSQSEQQELYADLAHFEVRKQVVRRSDRTKHPDDDEDQANANAEVIAPLITGRTMHLLGETDGDQGAKHFYMQARPSARDLGAISNEVGQALWDRAKQDATYWLGLIATEAVERDRSNTAIDFFEKRTLEAFPNGRWTSGARYNLARVYEKSGNLERAIELYEGDDSPQQHGSRLRARRLRASTAANGESSEVTAESTTSESAE
jgi:hypothetical protein